MSEDLPFGQLFDTNWDEQPAETAKARPLICISGNRGSGSAIYDIREEGPDRTHYLITVGNLFGSETIRVVGHRMKAVTELIQQGKQLSPTMEGVQVIPNAEAPKSPESPSKPSEVKAASASKEDPDQMSWL